MSLSAGTYTLVFRAVIAKDYNPANNVRTSIIRVTSTTTSCDDSCKRMGYSYGNCRSSCYSNEVNIGYCLNNIKVPEVPSLRPVPLYFYCCCGKTVTPTSFLINLSSGWNLFSLPVKPTSSLDSDCKTIGAIWHYSGDKYNKIKDIFIEGKVGWGYWIKVKEDCYIKASGNNITVDDFETLNAGWNQIGAPSSEVNFTDVIGNCNVTRGPLWYNPLTKSYVESSTLEPGKGYFVKVSSSCKLGVYPPPAPS
jgi:hypothetical protein